MEQETVSIEDSLRILLRRWWLLLLLPILAAVVAFHFTTSQPAAYETTTTLLLEGSRGASIYPELVRSPDVLSGAIEKHGLPLSVGELQGVVSAGLGAGSQTLRIRVRHSDPALAAAIANGVAESFVQYVKISREAQLASAEADLARRLAILNSLAIPGTDTSAASSVEAAFSAVSVLIPAGVPQGALPSHMTRNVFLALVAAGLIAVGLAFALEYLEKPVHSPEQLEQRFGITRLGTVPGWRTKRGPGHSLMVTGASDPASARAIEQVAANVEFLALSRGINALVVSSPETGEGRSSLVANLGVALAMGGREVILVDADLRRPSLHTYFELDDSRGLHTFLGDPRTEVTDVLQHTAHPRLRVVTARPTPTNPVELLKGPRMGRLLENLKEAADVVLLDSPPAVATPDSAVLASQAGGALLVVNSLTSRMEAARTTVENLHKASATIVGFVWNRKVFRPLAPNSRYLGYYRHLEPGVAQPAQEPEPVTAQGASRNGADLTTHR